MWPEDLVEYARTTLDLVTDAKLKIATAESCTGGLIIGCLTEVPGCSHAVDRGFITYSNEAKEELLGVPHDILETHGAVSEAVARAMVAGALANSRADVAVAVTGIAGPDGGSEQKPVGLVHIAAQRRGRDILHERHEFGAIGRQGVRAETVRAALTLLRRAAE